MKLPALRTGPKTLSNLDHALQHARDGFYVFPLYPGSKNPLFSRKLTGHPDTPSNVCRATCGNVGHGAWDGTRDEKLIRKWWTQNPKAGIGGALGPDLVGFDVDLQNGGWLPELPATRRHLTGRGNGNHHLIFKVEDGSRAAGITGGNGALGEGVDVKNGRGLYLVLPGTKHPDTGKLYEVDESAPREFAVLDDDTVEALYEEKGQPVPEHWSREQEKPKRTNLTVLDGGRAPARSTLAGLLSSLPVEGGRNDWLAKVCGHYAKLHREKRDLYEVECQRAASMLSPELSPAEVHKTVESLWQLETQNHPGRQGDRDSGYLFGNGKQLYCQVSPREEGDPDYDLFANFDVTEARAAVQEDGSVTYLLTLDSPILDKPLQIDLEAKLLGDTNSVNKKVAQYGLVAITPSNVLGKHVPTGTRLHQYLRSKKPQRIRQVETLGWDDETQSFVTHEGTITKDGWSTAEEAGLQVASHLKRGNAAPFTYGFDNSKVAYREVLQEVMTFQDPLVCAVFGAWACATTLKAQIHTVSSLFPLFGVEATSESGKTNGFVSLLLQLTGNASGPTVLTKAAFRDRVASHKNGVVWIDDVDDVSKFEEILRATTSNATVGKMGNDNTAQVSVQMTSGVLLTGEYLGLTSQKALADRVVRISMPSPTGRKSTRGPNRTQWEDVVALRERFPSLTQLAGWGVQETLRVEDRVLAAVDREKSRVRAGRHGEKASILLAGARLLDHLLGEEDPWGEEGGKQYRLVKAWVLGHLSDDAVGSFSGDQGEDTPGDNRLTIEVLPWALRTCAWRANPYLIEQGRLAGLAVGFLVRGGDLDSENLLDGEGPEVWVSSAQLALAWEREKPYNREGRTVSKDALRQQSDLVCEPNTSKVFQATGGTAPVRNRYRKLKPEYARLVLRRAQED